MKRRQLTLFTPENESENIEAIRKTHNFEQYKLIKSHVTLCREDEIESIEKIWANLEKLDLAFLPITFGKIVRFSEGKGVLLPAVGDNAEFHILRTKILRGGGEKPRTHEPHITLMHPRNATCTDDIFEKIKKYNLPSQLVFRKISLIEQDFGKPWRILKEFELRDA